MITIVALFDLKPECKDAFLRLAAECLEGSRAEEGNVDYNLYVSKNDPNRYFFIEVWKDEEAVEKHNASAHFQKFAGSFGPYAAGDPIIEQIEKI